MSRSVPNRTVSCDISVVSERDSTSESGVDAAAAPFTKVTADRLPPQPKEAGRRTDGVFFYCLFSTTSISIGRLVGTSSKPAWARPAVAASCQAVEVFRPLTPYCGSNWKVRS